MSLPSYKNYKNSKKVQAFLENAGSASRQPPYIPVSERNDIGNGNRFRGTSRPTEFTGHAETAPSINNGGPVKTQWTRELLDQHRSNMEKVRASQPMQHGPLGHMGSTEQDTFASATPPGHTPLVSQGIPVTGQSGQFESTLNEFMGNTQPPAPPMGVPGGPGIGKAPMNSTAPVDKMKNSAFGKDQAQGTEEYVGMERVPAPIAKTIKWFIDAVRDQPFPKVQAASEVIDMNLKKILHQKMQDGKFSKSRIRGFQRGAMNAARTAIKEI